MKKHASPDVKVAARDAAEEPEDTGTLDQYLTFLLGGEVFAMGILAVKEIIQYQRLTTVPLMPDAVRGVLNLRGAVVPVVDLSARFERGPAEVKKGTCIIIVETAGEGSESQDVGVMVDAVNQVLDIAPGDIEPPPTFGASIRADFIQGLGKVDGKFVILLDADKVLALEDAAAVLGRTERGTGTVEPAPGP